MDAKTFEIARLEQKVKCLEAQLTVLQAINRQLKLVLAGLIA